MTHAIQHRIMSNTLHSHPHKPEACQTPLRQHHRSGHGRTSSAALTRQPSAVSSQAALRRAVRPRWARFNSCDTADVTTDYALAWSSHCSGAVTGDCTVHRNVAFCT